MFECLPGRMLTAVSYDRSALDLLFVCISYLLLRCFRIDLKRGIFKTALVDRLRVEGDMPHSSRLVVLESMLALSSQSILGFAILPDIVAVLELS